MTKAQAIEFLQTLQTLPADKLAEVFDYLAFLRDHYAKREPVDVSDGWSEKDINDFVAASFSHAENMQERQSKMPKPGGVVTVDFPGAQGIKRRPVVVVSSDAYHASRPDVILAVLTTNIAASTTPPDYVLQDWHPLLSV